jgi:hypothetical protein
MPTYKKFKKGGEIQAAPEPQFYPGLQQQIPCVK